MYWRDNAISHWTNCYFGREALLRRTEVKGSGRRHDRSRSFHLYWGLHALKLPVRMAFTHALTSVVLCHGLIDIIGDSVYLLYANLCDLTRQTARVPGCDRADARRVCACAAGLCYGLCCTLSARPDLGRPGAPTPGWRRCVPPGWRASRPFWSNAVSVMPGRRFPCAPSSRPMSRGVPRRRKGRSPVLVGPNYSRCVAWASVRGGPTHPVASVASPCAPVCACVRQSLMKRNQASCCHWGSSETAETISPYNWHCSPTWTTRTPVEPGADGRCECCLSSEIAMILQSPLWDSPPEGIHIPATDL